MIKNRDSAAMSAAEYKLRHDPIAPLFRKYAIPGVVTLLFVGLQTIIDGIVLGNFVGANALASVSLILPCYSFISALAIVMGVGCLTLISINLGRGDRVGANNALRSASVFLLVFSVVMAAVTYIFAPQMARLLGANDVLISGAVDYFRALVPFFPLIVGMFFSDYVIKSIGRPVFSMITMSVAVILNIGLDLLFIGVMDMGTAGAGLATGLAFTVGAACNIPVVLFSRKIVSIKDGHFGWRTVGRMLYNGSSEGLSELSAGISTLLFNLALIHYAGEAGVAAFTATNYVFFIGTIIFVGISDGVIPIISYNFGAGQRPRVRQTLWLALRTNFLIGLTVFTALIFFGNKVISLFFNNVESDVISMASHGTSIVAFAFLVNGLNILASSYFTAMGNAKLSVVISLLRGLVFVAMGIYVLPKIFGIEGVWYAIPLAEAATLIVSIILVGRSLKR